MEIVVTYITPFPRYFIRSVAQPHLYWYCEVESGWNDGREIRASQTLRTSFYIEISKAKSPGTIMVADDQITISTLNPESKNRFLNVSVSERKSNIPTALLAFPVNSYTFPDEFRFSDLRNNFMYDPYKFNANVDGGAVSWFNGIGQQWELV
jgi:hypothetical protein